MKTRGGHKAQDILEPFETPGCKRCRVSPGSTATAPSAAVELEGHSREQVQEKAAPFCPGFPCSRARPTTRALHTAPAAPTGAPTPEQHQDRDTALPGSPTTSTKTPRTCKCFITIPGRQSTLQTAQREPGPWADEQRNAAIVGGKGQQSNCSHCRAGPSHTASIPAGCPWCSARRGRGWWQRRIPSVLELSCVPQQPGASTAALGTFREGDLLGMVPNRTRCHKFTISSFRNLFSGLFAGYLH